MVDEEGNDLVTLVKHHCPKYVKVTWHIILDNGTLMCLECLNDQIGADDASLKQAYRDFEELS